MTCHDNTKNDDDKGSLGDVGDSSNVSGDDDDDSSR